MSSYRRVLGAGTALLLVPVLLGQSTFMMRVATFTLVFSLLAIALNLVFGHTDQLFLFLGGLAGVGAYTTALAAQALGVTAWVTLPLGMVVCALLAGTVCYVAAKRNLTLILISILTLALQLALHEFFVGARSITNGSTGFAFAGLGLDRFGAVFESQGLSELVALYLILVVFVTLALAVYVRLIDSKYGMAFASIREDELAAESAGLDVLRYKVVAGALAGALVGLAGVTYVSLEGRVSPSLFTFLRVDVVVLIMLMVGGLRTTFGPLVGAWVVVVLRQALILSTDYQTAIFGALLVVLFLYFRQGVVPAVADAARRYGLPFVGAAGAGDTRDEPGDYR